MHNNNTKFTISINFMSLIYFISYQLITDYCCRCCFDTGFDHVGRVCITKSVSFNFFYTNIKLTFSTVIRAFIYVHSMKHTCDYCKTVFSSKGNILSHMQLKHMPHRSTFKCAVCKQKSKIYSQKKNARIHLKKHHFGGSGVTMTKMLRKRIDRKIIEINDEIDEQQTGNPGNIIFP